MTTNYRRHPLDEILTRLAADRPVVTPMRWCTDCGTDWNAKHFASCPVCAVRAHKEAGANVRH